MTTVAALDCGTNSTRLLIADGAGITLRREMRITRLGEDVDATGVLSEGALQRTFHVLGEYASLMRAAGVTRAQLIATSAARDAENGESFLSEAARITGADVSLLGGDQEAELSYRGATEDLDEDERPTMIMDIGGGSTELAVELDGILEAHSMQMGCVRVTERALGAGVATLEGIERASTMITDELNTLFRVRPHFARVVGRVRLVGLAGTVATLAQVDAGMVSYDRDAVHHRVISRATVVRWRDRLAAMTPAQRLDVPGMVTGREDVLVSGLFIMTAVMERFACDSVLSSESDILDGLVAVLLSTGAM